MAFKVAAIHLLLLLILVTPKTYGEKGPRRYKPDGSEEGKEGKADAGVSKGGKEGKDEGKKGGSWEEEEVPWLEGKQGECVFTHDCFKNVSRCTEIQDIGCSCLFGKCEMGGNPFVQNNECDTYKDCKCKSDPKNCFCRDSKCVTKAWECHKAPGKYTSKSSECDAMEKCKGKKCSCVGNTCEHMCNKTKDCETKEHWCFEEPGYNCTCTWGICEGLEKPKECKEAKWNETSNSPGSSQPGVKECIKKKLCSADKVCDCVNGYCTKRWWTKNLGDKACMKDQDCEEMLGMCFGGKCSCKNIKVSEGGEKEGTCQLKKAKRYN